MGSAQVQVVEHELKLPPRIPWQQKLVDAYREPEVRFIEAVMGRRAGKTHATSDLAGEVALETGVEVPWVAPTDALAEKGRQIFRSLFLPVARLRPGPRPKPDWKDGPPYETHLVGGGLLTFHSTHNKWTKAEGGKGLSILGGGYPLVILEEAARIPWGLVEQEILPTIADTGGKILAITTPRGRNNWTYRWSKLAQTGHPSYRFITGPSTDNPNPNIKAFVELMREEMDELLFRQEMLAEFIEGQGSVFRRIEENASLEWKTANVSEGRWSVYDKPQEGRTYVQGVDLAKHQDWTVVITMDVDSGAVIAMERFQKLSWPIIEDRVETASGLWAPPPYVSETHGAIAHKVEQFVDSTGVGDPVFDALQMRGLPVQGVKFTNESKSRLVQGLAKAMDTGAISYPDDELIKGELELFDYELLPSGRFRYGAPDGFHDDIVMALALAVYGRNQRITGVMV